MPQIQIFAVRKSVKNRDKASLKTLFFFPFDNQLTNLSHPFCTAVKMLHSSENQLASSFLQMDGKEDAPHILTLMFFVIKFNGLS